MFDLAPYTLHLAPLSDQVCTVDIKEMVRSVFVTESSSKLKGESAGGAGLTDTPS